MVRKVEDRIRSRAEPDGEIEMEEDGFVSLVVGGGVFVLSSIFFNVLMLSSCGVKERTTYIIIIIRRLISSRLHDQQNFSKKCQEPGLNHVFF